MAELANSLETSADEHDERDPDPEWRAGPSTPPPSIDSGTVGPQTDTEPSSRASPPPQRQRRRRRYLRLVLENNGSVARDHLASERTFLAYVRTSLGLAGAGVTLVQLLALTPTRIPLLLQRMGQGLGPAIIVLGLFVLSIGVLRYFRTQSALLDGKFPPAGLAVWAIAFALGALVLVLCGLLIAVAAT
ncbi:hypothetical protein DFH11DRAFT_1509395 [Phellopilus nigrolimitatus]|nr:hypothetical protein DFH11DRAFT_1509395 [Phellopilus nigrolimitatus]